MYMMKREFSQEQRQRMAQSGAAMPEIFHHTDVFSWKMGHGWVLFVEKMQ